MNFSEKKEGNCTKPVTACVFDFECENLLQKLISSEKFKENEDFKINKNLHVRIKYIDKNNSEVFTNITFYEPTAKVPVTPEINTETDKSNDLKSISNYDKSHVFMLIDRKNIYAIFQVSALHSISKLNKVFSLLGIKIKITDKINKSTINKIQNEKIRSISIGIETTMENIEDQKKIKESLHLPAMFRKESNNRNFYGTLTLNRQYNPELIESISQDLESVIDDLSEDFYITTRKDNVIKSSEIKTNKTYYAVAYGSKTITHSTAKEILLHFINTII